MARKRLLLVGWDAADWKLIHPLLDAGAMPATWHLVETGVCGNLATLEPELSPMLWTSIATGKHAYHHGVHGFTEVDPASGRVVPVSAATRRCKTLWQMLGEKGLKSHVVSWFATQGERDFPGCMVSNMFNSFKHRKDDAPQDWPAPPAGTYWPESLGEKLNELRVSPWDMDGDEIIRLFVPDAPKIDQTKNRRLWRLAERLAETFSVHAATCYLMEHEPDWDFTAVYYRAIDEICHEFMVYHPPRMAGIPERDFELYKEVVAGAYRLHDLLLARLLQLAGPDTAVVLVSDHGFHSDHLRPPFTPRVPAGITVWHRPHGVFAAAGPGFKADALVYGARLLDITPTILTWFGLPVGADMEGRVLREAFTEPPEVLSIPSWEEAGGPPPRRSTLSEADQKAVLDQFVALGYLDAIPDDPTQAAAETERENQWNLARACMDGGRLEQALPLLEDIYFQHPERADYAQTLARCQLRLGLLGEATDTIEACLDSFGQTETAHLIRANIALEKKDYTTALEHLDVVRERAPRDLQLLTLLGQALLRLRRWEDCVAVCRTALEVDPDNAAARLGLTRCELALGQPEEAMDHALEAVGLQYGHPQGHFLLGVALCRLKRFPEAIQALKVALKLAPRLFPAYRFLAFALRESGKPQAALDMQLTQIHSVAEAARERSQRAASLRLEAEERALDRSTERNRRRDEERRRREAAEASALPPDQEFVIVSGLPRSGTSLMMQMLEAGGLPAMSDGRRQADEDNPEGYREWEDIKKLAKQPLIIEQAQGKAIKVISALLPHLPAKHRYKIIFMRRPLAEVVSSQWKMLDRRGMDARSEREHLEQTQARHAEALLQRFRQSDRVQLIEVDYPSLVSNPAQGVASVAEFLGIECLPHPEAMAGCVRPDLYRNRAG
jgi:tetratricopeptide (TPR) repeat protein